MARNTATYDDALYWTVKDVGDWLERVGFYEYKEPLQTGGIDGKELFELSENKLRRLHPTRNMPTGRSDPASMLWKQINKVKENRRPDRKKSKNPFSGSRWGEKRPPQAPEPDYKPHQTTSKRDDGSEEENCWGSDFSDDEDNPEFEQAEDNAALLQGNTQGRTVSYNGSSTSSFTNLSSSASGKEDDSNLYLAPNTEEDFDQTYEVPSEQMNSSYGDADEIYDVPHDEEENNQQAFPKRLPTGGRSVSPLPQVVSPRHESLRPLPTLPPPQQTSWQQQQQQQHPSQMLELPGRISPRQPASPRHFKRAPEDEEQENYEVPSIEEPEQSEYEAPMMEQQEEEEEEEYLVADTTRVLKTRRLPELPQNDSGGSGGFPSKLRPPAPLPPPAGGGGPPPRPVKPPDLHFTSTDEAPPPPIPSRPLVSRSPVETKGFTTKVLPDPPPQTIRNIVRRSSGDLAKDKQFGNSLNMNNGSSEERRGLNQLPPPPLPVGTIKPPPLPKNITPETTIGSKDSANSNGSIAKMLNKFERTTAEEPESKRPQLLPRPQPKKPDLASKPAVVRQPWQKSIPTPPQEVNPPPSPSRQAMPLDDNRAGHPQKLPPPQPSPRLRFPDPSNVKATPPIPTKEQPKSIKKFYPHSTKAHPELPKKSEPKEEKFPSRTEPEKPPPTIRQVPVVPNKGDMTGYPWYDAELTRDEAVRILKETKKDGAFVVRKSTKPEPTIPYSLSLWFNNKPRNLHIRLRDDGKYALGKFKENEQIFDTPVLLIQYHMTTPLILAGDEGKTCLKIAAPNFR